MLTYSWALASGWADIFDVYIDLARFFTGSWFLDYNQLAFPPINETTSVAFAQIVLMADEEGWSFEMLARHLNQLFKVWEGEDEDLGGWWMFHPMPRGRVDTILTTLLTGVTGAGTNRIIDDMGFQFKMWTSVMDGRERPAHHDAHLQVDPAHMPFFVGGERLMFPGDPSGSVWNIANCRCLSMPVRVDPGEQYVLNMP